MKKESSILLKMLLAISILFLPVLSSAYEEDWSGEVIITDKAKIQKFIKDNEVWLNLNEKGFFDNKADPYPLDGCFMYAKRISSDLKCYSSHKSIVIHNLKIYNMDHGVECMGHKNVEKIIVSRSWGWTYPKETLIYKNYAGRSIYLGDRPVKLYNIKIYGKENTKKGLIPVSYSVSIRANNLFNNMAIPVACLNWDGYKRHSGLIYPSESAISEVFMAQDLGKALINNIKLETHKLEHLKKRLEP
jgi:hypothetical protein